jgi:hypothetical protein
MILPGQNLNEPPGQKMINPPWAERDRSLLDRGPEWPPVPGDLPHEAGAGCFGNLRAELRAIAEKQKTFNWY